jgi:hypothetical protein
VFILCTTPTLLISVARCTASYDDDDVDDNDDNDDDDHEDNDNEQ